MKDIYFNGSGDETSVIEGFSQEFQVKDIYIENLVRNGVRVQNLKDGNIRVGNYVRNVSIR